MTKYTPGPWRAHFFDRNQRAKVGDYGFTGASNATVRLLRVGRENTTAAANAKLVAAAPELLEYLEAYALPALNYLSIKATSASDRAEFKDRETKVRALIAKAGGAP